MGIFRRTAGLTLLHLNGSLAVLHKDGVADGDGYVVTILPTDSLPAGDYRFLERVTNPATNEAHNVGEGVVKVELDLALASPGACISHAERTPAIIEAQIEGSSPTISRRTRSRAASSRRFRSTN